MDMKKLLAAIWLLATASIAFGQGTAARRDANLSDMVNANTARSNIFAHIATNITVGTIPETRFPVVLQSLVTNNAATLTNVPWLTGISGIPAGFADGVDDTAAGTATAFTNATIGYGDEYRTNYISIATAGATNVGTLYSTRFGIGADILNSWDDVTNYFGQTAVVASESVSVATNGLEHTVSLSTATTNWIESLVASVNQHFYFTSVTQSFGVGVATNCFTSIDSPVATAATNSVLVNGSTDAYFLSYVSTGTVSRVETGPMELDFYYAITGTGGPTVTGHPEVYVWLTNDTLVEVATSGDTVYSGATVQRARVAMNVATSTNLPYGSRLMLRMKIISEVGVPTFHFVLGGDYDSHLAINVGAISVAAQTNIYGSFSNAFSIGTINSSNMFQVQTTNATLALQVSTNGNTYIGGALIVAGSGSSFPDMFIGSDVNADWSFSRAVDDLLLADSVGGKEFRFGANGTFTALTLAGAGTGITGLNPTNINSGYSSGLSIGGNAATATTAATANAGDSATAFFPSGQLEPTLFASNSPSANLILKATSASTAAWSAEAAGPTNIVNDGQYVRITDTNGTTRFLVDSNATQLIDGDGNLIIDETDSYTTKFKGSDNVYIEMTNAGGIFYKGSTHVFSGSASFEAMTFATATFTNAVFATNMPPATINPGDGSVIWNSNNAALYWVSYGNDGNPVATNAFGTGAATASTNLSNLTVTNSLIATNVQTAGITNNGAARVNGDLTVTGTITSDVVDFTTLNVTNMVLTGFTNTPFLGVGANGLLAVAYNGNSLTNLNGTNIVVDAAGFNGNLATTDTNLQQIAQKVDDLVLGGATGMLTNQFTTNVVGEEIVGLVKLAAVQVSGPQTNTATGTIWNSAGTHYITNNANGFGIDGAPSAGTILSINGAVSANGLINAGFAMNSFVNMSNPTGIFDMYADTNNWAPSSTANYIRMTNATSGTRNITGLASQAQGAQGRRLILHNMSELAAATITLKHEDASSTAANRFRCPGAVDFVIPCNGWVEIMTVTDGTAYRWYLNAN